LKRTTTTTKAKVVEVRVEPKTIRTADLNRIHYTTTSVPLEWET